MMVSIPSLLMVAGVAWAFPGNQHKVPYPPGGSPKPPLSTGISATAMTSLSTGASSVNTDVTVTTITDTITKTRFVPCSTPVATEDGHTYYSTWLTTSIWETTTCYPVTQTIIPPTPPSYHCTKAGDCPEIPGQSGCPPAATVTVTIRECGPHCTNAPPNSVPTDTPKSGPSEHPGNVIPGNCPDCRTLTFTDIYGGKKTIVVPQESSGVYPGPQTPPIGTGIPPSETITTSTASASSTGMIHYPREDMKYPVVV